VIQGEAADAGSPAPLYPFLYGQHSDVPAVLAQVSGSTAEKVREISALRRVVCDRDGERIAGCAQQLAAAFANGGRLFAFGNGGSATDAADLVNLFLDPGGHSPPLPAYLLTADVAAMTALSNDVGFEVVFARQLGAFARRGDLAVGLSTSGNSANLLAAFDEAHRRGMITVGLSGYSGGKLAELDSIDHLFVVPSSSVHRIQEAQTTIYHVLWELTLAALSDLDRDATQAGR
jgi:D-sedoheptulose 7-phosphate isomerase